MELLKKRAALVCIDGVGVIRRLTPGATRRRQSWADADQQQRAPPRLLRSGLSSVAGDVVLAVGCLVVVGDSALWNFHTKTSRCASNRLMVRHEDSIVDDSSTLDTAAAGPVSSGRMKRSRDCANQGPGFFSSHPIQIQETTAKRRDRKIHATSVLHIDDASHALPSLAAPTNRFSTINSTFQHTHNRRQLNGDFFFFISLSTTACPSHSDAASTAAPTRTALLAVPNLKRQPPAPLSRPANSFRPLHRVSLPPRGLEILRRLDWFLVRVGLCARPGPTSALPFPLLSPCARSLSDGFHQFSFHNLSPGGLSAALNRPDPLALENVLAPATEATSQRHRH